MRFGSLFSGIGGIDLGLERAGMSCAWQVEIEPYCIQVLEKHWPEVKRYGNIKEIDWEQIEPVDLICGGFPCQDVSIAGGRAGLLGDKSGLWFEFRRCIRGIRPRYILVENVPGLLSLGMGTVLGDLAESGYDAEWNCIPATTVGGPHLRDRVFILAYPPGIRLSRDNQHLWIMSADNQGNARTREWNGQCVAKPNIQRVAYGVPHRVDRLRALGNAVVPQVAEWLGRRILEAI